MFTQKQINLFWSHVDIQSEHECWNWKLSKDRYGYGKVSIDQVNYITHRVAYEIINGDIPKGKHILHSCDNSICCNPSHLKCGTRFENMQEMVERGRQGKVKTNPRKLNLEIAESIRNDFRSGLSKHSLAKKYNISRKHVRDILRGWYWKTPSSPPLHEVPIRASSLHRTQFNIISIAPEGE